MSNEFKDYEKELLNSLEVLFDKKEKTHKTKLLNSEVFIEEKDKKGSLSSNIFVKKREKKIKKKLSSSTEVIDVENKFQDLKKKLSSENENILNIKIENIVLLQDVLDNIDIKDEELKRLNKIYIRTYGAALRHSCSKFLSTLDNIFTGRVCGWELLLKKIKTNSLIFGNGFFADQVYLAPAQKTSSNTFINILFNTGIIGLFIFIYFMLNFLIKNFKIGNIYNNNIYISLTHHLVLYFIFGSIFEDTLAFVSLDFILLGISILIIKSHIKKDFTY